MNLAALIDFFRKGKTLEQFYSEQGLSSKSEVIEVYMENPFQLDSNIYFFEIEETDGKYEFEVDNKNVYNLFDLYYFLDFIEDIKEKEIDSKSAAEILFNYSIKDK